MRASEFNKALTEADLLEVNMSPSALNKWFNSPESDGIKMGIEFEMYVPDAGGNSDEDGEPDYSDDEYAYDIDDIMTFFDETAGRYERNRMNEEYHEWYSERLSDYVDENLTDEMIRDLVEEEFDINYFWDEAKDQLESEADDEEEEISDDDIESRAEELMNSAIDEEIYSQGRIYEKAYDSARESVEQDADGSDELSQNTWLDSIGVNRMSDAADYFDLSWPHIKYGGDYSAIGSEVSHVVGAPVDTSSDYHDLRRKPGVWIVEKDGSLDDPRDEDTDTGVEIVSPPQSVKKTFEDMNKIFAWAKNRGCYTNQTTGMHMNISVPDYSYENLDYIKLAIFMGDEYVLEQFGRAANRFCRSGMSKIKAKLTPEKTEELLAKMHDGMNAAASKIIHSAKTDKYTSINTHENRVEFRSPGGDYLSKSPEELSTTALRLAMALQIACDDEAYRQEYEKKLYQLLKPTQVTGHGEVSAPVEEEKDITKLFARYSAGELSYGELKQYIARIQDDREEERLSKSGVNRTFTVALGGGRNSPSSVNITVQATSRKDAFETARNLGMEYEPYQSSRGDWETARSLDDVTIFRGIPTKDLQRYLFVLRGTDGKIRSFLFRDIDSVRKYLGHHVNSWDFPVIATNTETNESERIGDIEQPSSALSGSTLGWREHVRSDNASAVSNNQLRINQYEYHVTGPNVDTYLWAPDQSNIIAYIHSLGGNPTQFSISRINRQHDSSVANTHTGEEYEVVNTVTGEINTIHASFPQMAQQIAARLWGISPDQVRLSDEHLAESTNTVKSLAPNSKLWKAKVKIKTPQYTGFVDAMVTAPNMTIARTMLKALYGAKDYEVGSTTEVK